MTNSELQLELNSYNEKIAYEEAKAAEHAANAASIKHEKSRMILDYNVAVYKSEVESKLAADQAAKATVAESTSEKKPTDEKEDVAE